MGTAVLFLLTPPLGPATLSTHCTASWYLMNGGMGCLWLSFSYRILRRRTSSGSLLHYVRSSYLSTQTGTFPHNIRQRSGQIERPRYMKGLQIFASVSASGGTYSSRVHASMQVTMATCHNHALLLACVELLVRERCEEDHKDRQPGSCTDRVGQDNVREGPPSGCAPYDLGCQSARLDVRRPSYRPNVPPDARRRDSE